MSLLTLGATLGLADGILNPCALAVLFFLIAYLMAIGLKRKCLFIGLIFIATVFTIYSLFMLGVLKVIALIGYFGVIKTTIASIAILAGILSLKDFFAYGFGLTLGIPAMAKPTIESLVKMATYPSAFLLGLLVSLVEIPCAGAFPLVYMGILAERVGEVWTIFYVVWYNFFFILPLLALTLIFYAGMLKAERAESARLKLRKYMRLVAGLILLTLGLLMLRGWL